MKYKFLIALLMLGLGVGLMAVVSKPTEKRVQNQTAHTQSEAAPIINDAQAEIKEEPLPPSKVLPAAAHTYQTFNNCGPATLSIALSWHGKAISQKELGDQMRPYQNQSGDNDDKAVFADEFVYWAGEYGIKALNRSGGDIDLLKRFIAADIPIAMRTWLKPGEEMGHYRFVRGYDDNRQVIIHDDSYYGPNKEMSYADFNSIWQPFNYEYILTYKDAQQDEVDAILKQNKDEKVSWQHTFDKANNEHSQDPQAIYPMFNLSVASYHLNKYEEAIGYYEQVASKLPQRMLWYQIEPILAYQKDGRNNEAMKLTETILSNNNRAFSELYQVRGEILLADAKTAQAKAEFEKALLYNKNFRPAAQILQSL